MEESWNDETSSKENVAVITTINSTGHYTINLNLNNEKKEVFSENKTEISNDITIGDIMISKMN